MEAADYAKWTNYHATVFAVRKREDLETLQSWRRVFNAARYTYIELCEATDWLAANDPPRFLQDHLRALHDCIGRGRAVDYRRADVEPDTNGTCTDCGGTGRVVVPHPRGISNGEWVAIKVARGGQSFYTAAVLCSCKLGRWYGQRGNPDMPMMTLEEYEKINPNWVEQREARWRLQVTEASLEGPLDARLQAAIDRLVTRTSQAVNGA